MSCFRTPPPSNGNESLHAKHERKCIIHRVRHLRRTQCQLRQRVASTRDSVVMTSRTLATTTKISSTRPTIPTPKASLRQPRTYGPQAQQETQRRSPKAVTKHKKRRKRRRKTKAVLPTQICHLTPTKGIKRAGRRREKRSWRLRLPRHCPSLKKLRKSRSRLSCAHH